MARGAVAETNPSVWRYWAARLTLQRAILQEQFSDLHGKRARAEKRAKAAEMIAQEANSARLKALLDAAREQATVRNIESAEQRFADARGDFEAAHQALSPAEDTDAGQDQGPDRAAKVASPLHRSAGVVAASRQKTGSRIPLRIIVGGAALLVVVSVGTVYLLGGTGVATDASPAAPSTDTAVVLPPPAPPPVALPAAAAAAPQSPAVVGQQADKAPKADETELSKSVMTTPAAVTDKPDKATRNETAAVAATVERSVTEAETTPIKSTSAIASAPDPKPVRAKPKAPPAPGPNPFRVTVAAEPTSVPPQIVPPLRLPE